MVTLNDTWFRTREFLQQMKVDLNQGLVPAKVHNDPTIHALELRQIFARCWVYIGHETEVPQPGDYRLRRIGVDPFIFVRDEDGNIRVLFNGCRHRGAAVCQADEGRASYFRCPYHGWTYKNTGELIGVPARAIGYQGLNLAHWGLLEAPRVESYCGLVFANLDPAAPSLRDYLGGFRWYLDIHFNLTDGGMEVIGEPHRWWVDADWKNGAENFAGDSSHTQMAHRSALQTGITEETAAGPPGTAYGLHINCDGHAISIRQLPAGATQFFGYPKEISAFFRPGPLSEAQFDLARRSVVHTGTIFPNLSFIHFSVRQDSAQPPAAFLSLRVWQPRGPGRMEIWSWILAPKEASDEYKERAYRAGMSSFSPSGNFEQDDVTVWSTVARTAGSTFAELRDLKFNYQMGMPGIGAFQPLADWPGPGEVWPSNAGESGPRAFYRRWIEHMLVSSE